MSISFSVIQLVTFCHSSRKGDIGGKMWRKLGRGYPATQGDAVSVSLECGPLTGRRESLQEGPSVDCPITLSTCVQPSYCLRSCLSGCSLPQDPSAGLLSATGPICTPALRVPWRLNSLPWLFLGCSVGSRRAWPRSAGIMT